MAWPKDQTKPYDPYAPGTPTANAQSRMNRAAAGAVNQAISPARNLSGALGGNILKGFGDRLSADASARSANATAVANTQANRAAREGLGKRFPEGRMVIDQRPIAQSLSQPPAVQRDGIQSRRIDPATQKGFKTAMTSQAPQQISRNIPEARKALVGQYSNQGSVQRPAQNTYSGTQRIGDMDVAFDKSMSPAARRAFIEAGSGRNPTGVAIDPDLLARSNRAHQIQYLQRIEGGGFAPIHGSSGPRYFGVEALPGSAPSGPQQPELLTQENSPGMGWKQRTALNERILANKGGVDEQTLRNQGGIDEQALRNQGGLATQALQNEPVYARNAVDMRGQDFDFQATSERNRIDAMTAGANSQVLQLDAEGKNLDIREKLAKERDFARYSDPKTTEVERQAIARKWGIKTENSEFDTLDQFDLEGNRTGQTLYNKATGEIIQGGQPQQAPAAAIEFLRKNPDQAENFKRKYGYLPS